MVADKAFFYFHFYVIHALAFSRRQVKAIANGIEFESVQTDPASSEHFSRVEERRARKSARPV